MCRLCVNISKKWTVSENNVVGENIQRLEDAGKMAIIMASPIVRMYFKKMTQDYYKDLIVISYNEVEPTIELQSVGMVTA